MKVKTAELSVRALDWAVAEIKGRKRITTTRKEFGLNVAKNILPPYSTEWAWCGPLISEFGVWVSETPVTHQASCETNGGRYVLQGDTPQIAICRAVVASKLGDTVDIPDELMERK